MKKQDITGRQFGKLTAVAFSKEYRYPNGERGEEWLCQCSCGNQLTVLRKNLLNGNSTSCGCTRIEKSVARLTKHAGRHTRLYNTWCSMKSRCCSDTDQNYQDYGGRGITVCDAWLNDFDEFRRWALSNGYDDNLTIDRIDVNRGYEPGNCRWTTRSVQANNRRNTIYITHNGETHTCAEWSKITGINYDTLHNRVMSGKNDAEIFFTGRLKTGPK